MGSPFDALVLETVAPAVSSTFGRTWQLQPMMRASNVNAPTIADPSRPAVIFLAALHLPKAKPLITNAYDPRTNRRPGVETDHPLLRIQPDQIQSLGLVVKALDLVLDVDSGVTWLVGQARTTEHGVRECDVHVVG